MSTLTTAVSTGPWSGEMRERPDGAREGRLLAALAAGDRTAAEELVRRTYRGVLSLQRRLLRDPDLAADLTQETYRKAWDALPAFNGRSQFSTWLFRIAYTTFLNHMRGLRRLVPLDERHESIVPDPAPAADEEVDRVAAGGRL